jgi:acetyl esterase/lipase
MKYILYIIAFTLFTTAGCSSTDEATSEPVSNPVLPQSVEKDVSYGSSAQQSYDLYLPKGRTAATTKTVIIIHGGSWVGGDKNDVNGFVTLVQTIFPDYAIVNMNYRLANGSTIAAFPNQTNDIDDAVQQLVDRKDVLQINGEFALMGASAGAHLATLYDYRYDEEDRVKAIVNVVGPVDFTDPFYANNAGFQALFDSLVDETAFAAGTDLARAVSPVLQVTAQSAPTINFYGNQDTLVALSQLTRLEQALTDHQIPFESTIVNGGHGNWTQAQYADVQAKIKTFLELHF